LFSIYQGETVYIKVTVLDEEGTAANLAGATAKFACSKGTELFKKECTISDNIITAKFAPVDTKTMLGKYLFEVKIEDATGDIDTLLQDYVYVMKSIIPDYTIA